MAGKIKLVATDLLTPVGKVGIGAYPPDLIATGVLGGSGATVTLPCQGLQSVAFDIATGSLSGTVTLQATLDDQNWFSVYYLDQINRVQLGTVTSFPSRGHFAQVQWSQVRLNVTSYSSGASQAILRGSYVRADASNLAAFGTMQSAGDGIAQPTAGFLNATSYVWAPTGTTTVFDRVRTPTTFNSASATASGDTAVHTPTSGKKFRLMGWKVEVTANAAQSVAGVMTILLRDGTAAINGAAASVFVPGAAGTTFVDDYESAWVAWGNGFLSAAANNVLNINLSTAFTAGNARAVVALTEE